MSLLFALATAASVAAGASATCVPLGEAATEAGLTGLVGAIGLVADLPDAESLLAAVTATDPLEGPVTVLAPVNEAFEEIADVVATLTPELVLAVLSAHIVPGAVEAAGVIALVEDSSPASVETLFGTDVEFTLSGDNVMVSPADTDIDATVVITDVPTCAGVVHVVDKVLVPAFPAPEFVGSYGDGTYGAY